MAMVDRPVTGLECKLYYNTATHAAPTWVEVTRAINVSVSSSKGEADQSSRISGYRMTKGALKDFEVTFGYRKKQGTETVFAALQAAYLANTAYEWAVLDGAVTENGAQGVRFFGEIMGLNVNQDLEGTEEAEFTLKPTYKEESAALVNPDWYTV